MHSRSMAAAAEKGPEARAEPVEQPAPAGEGRSNQTLATAPAGAWTCTAEANSAASTGPIAAPTKIVLNTRAPIMATRRPWKSILPKLNIFLLLEPGDPPRWAVCPHHFQEPCQSSEMADLRRKLCIDLCEPKLSLPRV